MNEYQNMKYCKILFIIFINTHLVLQSSSLKPIKIQNIGSIIKISYPNFNLISPSTQAVFLAETGQQNQYILSNLLKSLPKTQKCIQLLALDGKGLYEMIILSEANNFDNKIIIVKQNPHQFVWVNKNIYLNGFEGEQYLYNVVLSDKDQVTPYFDPKYTISYIMKSNEPHLDYTIHSTLPHILKHALHSESATRDRSPVHYKIVELFLSVHSKRLASIIRQQLQQLHQLYKIELILQLNVKIPLSLLIPSAWTDNLSQVKISLYKLNIKVNDKKSSIQFKNIKQVYTDRNQKNNKNWQTQLEQGIYYVTTDHILFNKLN